MKKNILTVIILAATLVNLTLTAMVVFVFVPYVKKADTLITNILKVLELELESPIAGDTADYEIADLILTQILTDETCNLKVDSDGESYYAKVTASISVNSKHKDYEKKKDLIESNMEEIKAIVIEEINKSTTEDLSGEYKSEVEAKILERLQSYLQSRYVVKVTLRALIQY